MENLDAMTASDLWALWTRGHRHPVRLAREWFPARPKGYVTATSALIGYASNKATAMGCRATGDINAALVYERICETIYEDLPTFARW
jgi:hypothetical protein